MANPNASINVPQWDGEPREAAEVWTATKGLRTARCSLWTHPTRAGEVRLTVDDDLQRSEALSGGLALVDLALTWKRNSKRRAGP